jgi:thioredoxin 1
MMIVNVTELTDNNFEGFTSDGISLVDIWAPWCGPCRMISPIIDELSDEYKDKEIKFGKLNADDSSETVSKLGVRNIPTILIYKDGEVVERTVGMVSKNQLKDLIDNHLQVENNQ